VKELSLVVHHTSSGPVLVPATQFDRGVLRRLCSGDILTAQFQRPSGQGRRRYVFAMIAFVFTNQERFDDPDALRRHLSRQTSFVTVAYDESADRTVLVPTSWRSSEMDDEDFAQIIRELVPVILAEFFPGRDAQWLERSVRENAHLDGLYPLPVFQSQCVDAQGDRRPEVSSMADT
jgi:hypothetical protein